jgi:hypothetical protein
VRISERQGELLMHLALSGRESRAHRVGAARPALLVPTAALLCCALTGCGSSEPVPAEAPPAAPSSSVPSSVPSEGASTPDSDTTPPGNPPSSAAGSPSAGGKQLRIAISAFSWQDNDPPNSAQIGAPVLHQSAGGQGTYADPITVSVPAAPAGAGYPPGSRFYLPSIQRYVIAEDTGGPPGPPGTDTALNVWIDGRSGTPAEAEACEDLVTGGGTTTAQFNPPPGLPVMAGPIYNNHTCNIPPQ